MGRRSFSPEFKLEAIKLVRERGVMVAQAARDLGLHQNVLRKWVRDHVENGPKAFPGRGKQRPDDAWVAPCIAAVAMDAMSKTFDSAELFRIQMQQLSRTLTLVPHHRGARLQIPPARQSSSSEDARHASCGEPQAMADEASGAPLPSQRNDLRDALNGDLPRTAARPARPIQQPRRALRSIALQPLLGGRQ